ncbi:MAG: hypothetical protein K6E30_10130 [Lachnospiraceae bacterium]|nr:hypothetical protein [Lachnospiraceae bacterium]
MKKRFRFLSALLIAVMAWSLYAAAFAAAEDTGGISVYIPNKIARLHLPDMPEYIALYTRTETTVMKDKDGKIVYETDSHGVIQYDKEGNPIPKYGIVNDANIELFFSEQPDWAAVIWPEGTEYISVNENGYALVSSAGHKTQPGVAAGTMLIKDEKTGETKRVWATTTADHLAGEDAPAGDGAFLAGKNGVTVLYNRDGSPVWVEYTIHDDFYKTGIYGAVTTIRYERVVISGDHYIFEVDETGNPVYDENGVRQKQNLKGTIGIISLPVSGKNKSEQGWKGASAIITLKDGNSFYVNTVNFENSSLSKDGQVIYNAKISAEDNGFINIELSDEKSTFYVEAFDYSKFDFSKEGLGVFTAKLTQMNGYVHFDLYNEKGKFVTAIDFTNAFIVKDNLKKIYSDINVGNISIIHFYYTTWYISKVVTEYPDDVNYIVGVESDWKNNSGQFLWGYKITYATSAKERYRITYMPNTTTILEDHGSNKFYEWDDPTYPSTDLEAYFEAMGAPDASDFHGMYLHHYEEDTPIYGEYTDGTLNLVSGSGDYLPYWYEEGHGARVYKRLYPCTYFSTPRYK